MIIFDAPFKGITPFARYSAYPFLVTKSSSKTLWLIDDSRREEEVQIIQSWAEQSKLPLQIFGKYSIMGNLSEFDLNGKLF